MQQAAQRAAHRGWYRKGCLHSDHGKGNKTYMEVLTARSTVMRFMVITHVVIPHIPDRTEYCETVFIQNLSNVPL